MAKNNNQISFAELLASMSDLQAQIQAQANDRIEEIKDELEQISSATGKSIAELLGLGSLMAVAPKKAAAGSKDPERDSAYDTFKTEYIGQWVGNPENDNWYQIGSARGRASAWIKDNMEAIRAGKLDVMTDEEYKAKQAA